MNPPLPYHIYVKSPTSKRFTRATVKGLETLDQAYEYLDKITGIEIAQIGTRYQIRQGRALKLSITKTEG